VLLSLQWQWQRCKCPQQPPYQQATSSLDFTGLNENKLLLSLYPNPVKDIFVIAVAPELIGQELHMTNLEGKSVLSQLIGTANQAINVQQLPSGIYFLQIGEGVQKELVE
jgi:hypothetical protein